MEIINAANLIKEIYSSRDRIDVHTEIDLSGVQAAYLNDGTLIIPGTNEFSDWYRFNFDVYDLFGGTAEGFDVARGDSGASYHAGFLEHATTVYAFAKPLKPKLIIGHSLGAASAQIVGSSLQIPALCFASPKTLRSSQRIKGEDFVMNICRSDDTVCHVPMGFLGFRHIGKTLWLNPQGSNAGQDHRIDEYLELMEHEVFEDLLPKGWPEELREEVAEALTD
ncbi:hypothetical protein [Pseudoroseicyclus aestuarii]|uniref:Lipase (Class 3) n=1 Tax=Pseudoroseicyclus aestuarii TaxID=1795041 RepID=A0A318SV57_9RHOB|nr:hypothetical protein [Pseudoroseicyclus aestuarii]PYE85493.1 hypothetical protein DFP88_101160 [Pseudoroseicyclus aestuarii]